MKIYLIRHGETGGNREKRYIGKTDEPLTAEAEKELQNRTGLQAETVFVSPMKRCRQTAEILFPHQPVRILEELAECDFGTFENKNWKELSGDPAYQAWIDSNGTLLFPQGEDPAKFRKRCCRGFEKGLAECFREKTKSAAFVVHGGTIMSILERYGVPRKDFYQWHVKNGQGYELEVEDSLWIPFSGKIDQIKPLLYTVTAQ